MKTNTLEIQGDPFTLGKQHGAAFRTAIVEYTAERVALAGSAEWTGGSATRAEVLAVAERCVAEHRDYSPRLFEELEGVAAATDLSLAELVVSGGFTDFIDTMRGMHSGRAAAMPQNGAADDCTAFLVPANRMADGAATLAQTWDMHEGSAEHLVLLRGRPRGAPDFIVMTTAGCLGMIGMNEAGVCVGINNLTASDGRIGVTWPFAVRAMLEQETAAAALDVLRKTKLAGGHNFLVLDAAGVGANVEAMPTALHEDPLLGEPIAHTNHCLADETIAVQTPRAPEVLADSQRRLDEARRHLSAGQFTAAELQAITADTAAICKVGKPPLFVGTCGGVVMIGAKREMWAVAGRPSESRYTRFSLAGAAA